VRDIFRDGGTYALVTEFADGGNLWDLVGGSIPDDERVAQRRAPLDERSVREIALAVLDALAALHENDIVHRDIKPQNVLRCDDTWKIADFGISKLEQLSL
jgi:serine/threonine protein kinase